MKKKTGKLMSMDRMKYLSSDFPVYQLSEKSNFLEYSSLRLFCHGFGPKARKGEKPNGFFYLFLEQQFGKTRGNSSHC